MSKTILAAETVTKVGREHYLIRKCNGCNRKHCKKQTIASINCLKGGTYEFRYTMDNKGDYKTHPGISIKDYCHHSY